MHLYNLVIDERPTSYTYIIILNRLDFNINYIQNLKIKDQIKTIQIT